MQIIFGEKCVSLLRLFFAAVLMLWCAQTAAYSGQCHTTQGNPYIGVNFGVKTLEEEANTAGVVKDKFYQWNESGLCVCCRPMIIGKEKAGTSVLRINSTKDAL